MKTTFIAASLTLLVSASAFADSLSTPTVIQAPNTQVQPVKTTPWDPNGGKPVFNLNGSGSSSGSSSSSRPPDALSFAPIPRMEGLHSSESLARSYSPREATVMGSDATSGYGARWASRPT